MDLRSRKARPVKILRDWLAGRALEEGDLFGTLAIMRNRSEKLTIVLTDVTLGGT